jgi:hypothetical protein
LKTKKKKEKNWRSAVRAWQVVSFTGYFPRAFCAIRHDNDVKKEI